jgi:hypothetical protein
MVTVNFSVPEAIEQSFNETFKDRNKSAIIAELMREAVVRAQQRQRRADAIDRILERRKLAPRASDEELRAIREDDRP